MDFKRGGGGRRKQRNQADIELVFQGSVPPAFTVEIVIVVKAHHPSILVDIHCSAAEAFLIWSAVERDNAGDKATVGRQCVECLLVETKQDAVELTRR